MSNTDLQLMTDTADTIQKTSAYRPGLAALLGKVRPASSTSLVPVDPEFALRTGMFMHIDAYKAFVEMHRAAEADGINLTIISAFRSFNHQKRIWENKWNGRQRLKGGILAPEIIDYTERAKEILKYSAMPGTSRHHWGTDIDLNSLENSFFDEGEGLQVYTWLVQNAHLFGFCQPYTKIGDSRTGGYEEEKWHWSYMPVANIYLDAYQKYVNYEDIKGFDGWETAREIDVIQNYVVNINKACLCSYR